MQTRACLAFAAPVLAVSAAAAQAQDSVATPPVYQPAPGSNQIFRETLSAAPGSELILTDLAMGPNAVGPAHSHPWEEYLYVIGGSTTVDLGAEGSTQLESGQALIIPPHVVHTPRAGPDGVRAIVVRVHHAGDPISIPSSEE